MSWEIQNKLYNLHIRMKHFLGLELSFVLCISLKTKQLRKIWIKKVSNHTYYLGKRKHNVAINIQKFFIVLS